MGMSNKKNFVRNRLSIDINPEEHQKIKLFATLHGTSIIGRVGVPPVYVIARE